MKTDNLVSKIGELENRITVLNNHYTENINKINIDLVATIERLNEIDGSIECLMNGEIETRDQISKLYNNMIKLIEDLRNCLNTNDNNKKDV